MRKLFFTIIVVLGCFVARGVETYFPYPTPPESLTTLTSRTNYVIEHFWDRCNMKSAFSSRAKLAEAFDDYVSLMPYATADTVHMSIDKLIKSVKNSPKNLLTLGEIAENALYGDSAEMVSDEAYLPFAKAVAECKKIPAVDRARFEHQAKVLSQSQVGQPFPTLKYTKPDGTPFTLAEVTAPYIVVFINDPDCSDCRMARARLSANYDVQRLSQSNTVQILSLYPDSPDEAWQEAAAEYPTYWAVAASDQVDDNIDIRSTPAFYFLDADRKILVKNIPVDNIINALALMPDITATTTQPTTEGE